MKSVLQDTKECYICRCTSCLEDHHIFFGTSNRKRSEKRGLKVWLCGNHHRNSPDAVHKNRQSDLRLKEMAQAYYEQNIGTRQQFIIEFGKSYL
ncbi:phosphoenolpyruvate carboxykinase [Lacrimispora sp.]|uniref:phosphoenolpyruvate carboxykinase n=1 Tax=Lacrimispora sp. TaxID=2719234 RepID=UPI00345FA4FC